MLQTFHIPVQIAMVAVSEFLLPTEPITSALVLLKSGTVVAKACS
jgi:hypothetical protein